MSNNQLFFSLAGLMLTMFGMAFAFFKYYIDAKIDPVYKYVDTRFDSVDARFDYLEAKFDAKFAALDAKFDSVNNQLKFLVDYMILHQGKIAVLEERTKNLNS